MSDAKRVLAQFEDGLAAAVERLGFEAIAGSCESLATLTASPLLAEMLQAELQILLTSDSLAGSRWNGRELVLSARRDWSLALALYEPGTSDIVHSLPNIGCFTLLTGSASLHRYSLPHGFDERQFDTAMILGDAEVVPLRPHQAICLDGRTHAVRIDVQRPAVILRLFSGYIADFQWQFDPISGRPRSIGIARPEDTELESMILTLGAMKGHHSVELLTQLCSHRNHELRWRAIQNLSRIDMEAAIFQLHAAANDPHAELRAAAARTLERVTQSAAR